MASTVIHRKITALGVLTARPRRGAHRDGGSGCGRAGRHRGPARQGAGPAL